MKLHAYAVEYIKTYRHFHEIKYFSWDFKGKIYSWCNKINKR